MVELSHHFEQSTLENRRHDPSFHSQPPTFERDESSASTDYFSLSPNSLAHERRRRQAMVRSQCTPAHLLRIRALVKQMVDDGVNCSATHPTSLCEDSVSPLVSPTIVVSPPPSTPCSEDDEPCVFQPTKRQQTFRVSKDRNHTSTVETTGKHSPVWKDIRKRRKPNR